MKPRVVMKFGGTSLGTPEAVERAARHIVREEAAPVVVASAVGGVTDLLIEAGDLARSGKDFGRVLGEIAERHRIIAEAVCLEGTQLAEFEGDLERMLHGVAALGELSPRITDSLLSFGERASVHLLAAAVSRLGRPARAFASWELGLTTNGDHGRAEALPEARAEIGQAVKALAPGEVPIVTGYIGRTREGEITTLGRGGSDLTASIFGAAVGAEEIQIWTDVQGILRADPKAVPEVEVVPELSFEEAAELAYFGAKVLHPRTMEPARDRGIPVRVLGTFHVDCDSPEPVSGQGTLIHARAPEEPIRAMALQQKVQSLHVHSMRMLEAPGFLSRVFEILARHRISVDVIATSEVSISMTLDLYEGDLDKAIEEISSFAEVKRTPGRSILCLVGAGIRRDTGLLARIFRMLAEEEVPVHVISQGASRINITLVTEPPHGEKAMRRLYEGLFGRSEKTPQ